jgi:hypothetical protein
MRNVELAPHALYHAATAGQLGRPQAYEQLIDSYTSDALGPPRLKGDAMPAMAADHKYRKLLWRIKAIAFPAACALDAPMKLCGPTCTGLFSDATLAQLLGLRDANEARGWWDLWVVVHCAAPT